jgi:tripartite-type tricarboxylate transporter receptor subunit TctC
MNRRAALAAILATAALPRFARAETYPKGQIRLIVPTSPGGVTDTMARIAAHGLTENLKANVIVDNRPGGNGSVGAIAVAHSPPDGLNLLVTSDATVTANPSLSSKLGYNAKEFTPIIVLCRGTPVLVVNSKVPAKSVKELIALAKEKPGQINFAHSGAGAAIHLAAELFQALAGIKMNGVAYRGAPPGLNDVMAGHVALMFADAGSVVAQINAGKVRALGVSSTIRVPALPNVPTIAEAGVPGFDAVGWTLICAPSATPKPIVDRLHKELKAVAATPDVNALFVRLGVIAVDSPPPAELQKFLASEIDRWGALIERAGLAKTQ